MIIWRMSITHSLGRLHSGVLRAATPSPTCRDDIDSRGKMNGSGPSLCQLDLAHFDTFIWPPCGTKRSPVPLSALGGPGRSEALRRVFCGASRAERRPGLPRASDQNIGCGTLPSG